MQFYKVADHLRKVSKIFRHIGNLALAFMMFLTTADVAGRYFFNSPILGAFEITEYLMLLVIFSFLAFAQAEKAHISVDILFARLPQPVQTVISFANHLACLLITLLMTWMGVKQAISLSQTGEMSTLLKIPDYPFAIFLVIGCTVLSLEFFIDVITTFSNKETTNS